MSPFSPEQERRWRRTFWVMVIVTALTLGAVGWVVLRRLFGDAS